MRAVSSAAGFNCPGLPAIARQRSASAEPEPGTPSNSRDGDKKALVGQIPEMNSEQGFSRGLACPGINLTLDDVQFVAN
jgi:hypothetical protein